MTDPRLLLVIGPSGSGKSTIVDALQERGLITVTPTWTTRCRRSDEAGGSVNHRFVSDDEFSRLERRRFFLGTARLAGVPHRYGLPRVRAPRAGSVAAVVARAHVVPFVRRHYPAIVYQIEAPADRADAVLCGRGSADRRAADRRSDVERRVGRAVADRIVVNDGPVGEVVAGIADVLIHDLGLTARRPA